MAATVSTMIDKLAHVATTGMSLHSWCITCDQGFIAFWRCGDDGTVVLLCQACGLLWLAPSLVETSDRVRSDRRPSYPIPGRAVCLGDAPARWATRDEIRAKGWDWYIEDNPEYAYHKAHLIPLRRRLTHAPCVVCSEGTFGFWRCDRDGLMLLRCEECSCVRASPTAMVPPVLTETRYDGRWATRQEVTEMGWHFFVAQDHGVAWRETEFAVSLRDPAKEMWAHSRCEACPQGLVGFWRCGDAGNVVLLCDTCGLLWRSPAAVGKEARLATSFHPTCPVPGQDAVLGSPPSRWATRAEIEARGWGELVLGARGALAGQR